MTCKSKADESEDQKQKEFGDNKSTGNCAIEMRQKDEPQADQSWYEEKTGTFEQLVYISLSLLNKTDKPVAVTKVSLEYQDKTGNWVPCDSISLGHRQRPWYYNWGQIDPKGFNVGENITTDMAVRAGIKVKALNFDKLRRIHHSLPDPISIKIWLEDGSGGKTSIVVEYKSGPLELIDEKSKRKDTGKEDLQFLYCDDVDAEARIWAAIVKEEDSRWGTIVQYSNWQGNGGKYFYASDFKKILYKATKENKSEFEVEECKIDDKKLHCGITVTALVDLKEHYVYGLKFDLFTSSSSTTEYYLAL